MYHYRNIKHHIIDATNRENALNEMLGYMQVKPILSAKYALLNSCADMQLNEDIYENSN